ncbi:DUF5683 domain-containing protein [Flavobacterium sp. N502540]|uniref:DUF5683 domain-containing protein n=1 Tax=Flavobacterium sp. N502540 TaxID=2986838 RepID=UPI0022241529|nr:DUF5683 domain-containing protein [Flavobacterium sp. N502540]
MNSVKVNFYSAILPGLGQVYNKKYWKVPFIYGTIGIGISLYIDNQKQYNIYRNEYKNRLAEKQSDSEYLSDLSNSQLLAAQKQFKLKRDLSLLCIILFYALNIIDANIAPSLSQFNASKPLTLRPMINTNTITLKSDFGFSCIYNF